MSSFKKKYGQWALVTGASSGIGKALVYQLAQQGFNIILVSRKKVVLNEISQDLQDKHQVSTYVVATDLTSPGAVKALYNEVESLDIGLVIPSAGVDEMGQFLDKDYEDLKSMLSINVEVPTEIAHIFGKKLASRKCSGLILVSSLFAYQGIPNFATYAASKAYILTLGEALNVELAKDGVDVLVLSPGLTDTPFSQSMEINLNRLPMIAQQPQKVAKVALSSLGRKPTVVSGIINKVYAWENRFIPRSWPVNLFGFLIGKAIKSYHSKQASSGNQTPSIQKSGGVS